MTRPDARFVQFCVAVFVLSLLAGFLGGCATNPRLRLAQVNQTFAAVEYRLVEEAAAGNLTPGEVLLADPLIQSGRAILDDAERRLDAGEREPFQADLRALGAIIERLTQLYLTQTYLRPTTQP